jgi:hypothetical protein
LKEEFGWLLGEEFQKLREGFEPVDNREFMKGGKNEKSEDPAKGKTTPYTKNNIFSLEQSTIFWQKFGDLENAERHLNPGIDVDKSTISGEKLQGALVSSGKFTQSDAAIIINDMEKDGLIEKVAWDTYRRKNDNNNRRA